MYLKLLSLNEDKMEYTAYSVILKFQNDFAAYFFISKFKNEYTAYSFICKVIRIYAHPFIIESTAAFQNFYR